MPVALKTYWSPERGDNFSIASADGERDAIAAGYVLVREEALVFTEGEQSPGMVPLKLFWNPARGDNFTTATAQGEQDALTAGYQFIRNEGYVHPNPVPGSVPLKVFWNPVREDNFSTASAQGERDALANEYQEIRVEGYVLPLAGDVDAALDRCGRLPPIETGSTDLAPDQQSTVDAGGVAYIVTERRRRIVNDVVEHAFLQDIARMGVWPGQVIQGKSLLSGDVANIGPLARQPGTISITDVITDTPSRQSAVVELPDAANVDQARREILQALRPKDSPGMFRSDFQRASTLREVGAKLGLNVKGANFGVDANATLDQTRKQSTAVGSIRQIFYSATFAPHESRAGGFWHPRITWADIEPFAGPGNPPLYIDSVQYGRFICVTAQGAFSSLELTAALKAHYKAMTVEGGGAFEGRHKEVLESSQAKIYTIGVPGRSLFQDLTDPVRDLNEVYRSGQTFSLDNPGLPVSFTCRHIADNTVAHVGLVAEFIEPLSAVGVDVSDAQFDVFDGPGGGLVATGIRVNPGDKVTVQATGRIWSGVAFSQPHGPEGWRGHRAGEGSPLPGKTAYALIIRFGTSSWLEAGAFWEGTPPSEPGSGGMLQLNVNDDNPDNGDPRRRWSVRVDVKRAAAGAAGVYI